eukprot:m.423959 g.423959  ORF g.423959 m.423959 type:complete len:100 (+) comp21335_c0_seq4:2436-2735(+)
MANENGGLGDTVPVHAKTELLDISCSIALLLGSLGKVRRDDGGVLLTAGGVVRQLASKPRHCSQSYQKHTNILIDEREYSYEKQKESLKPNRSYIRMYT